jgi:hypothetical protein
MSKLARLAARFVPGVLLRRTGRLPDSGSAAFNAFFINVALPVLILILSVPAWWYVLEML